MEFLWVWKCEGWGRRERHVEMEKEKKRESNFFFFNVLGYLNYVFLLKNKNGINKNGK